MEIEPITFGKGVILKRSPLYLQDGELVTCEGFSFDYGGLMTSRPSKQKVDMTAIGSIHSIHRNGNIVLVGDDGNMRYKWDLDGYCNNYTPENGNFTFVGPLISDNRWRTADYEGFTFIATEGDMYAFLNGYYFNCTSITSPAEAPSVSSTGGSGTAANHTWYYTYVYRFKNGHQYESGLSPGKVVSANPTGQTATINAYNSTQYPLSGSYTINGGIDAYAKGVYHFDGADASTTITDSSIAGTHTGTCVGAVLDTEYKKFGSASLLLDGVNDYVTVPDDVDFYFGTDDFTVDFWFRTDGGNAGAHETIISQYQDADNYWRLYFDWFNPVSFDLKIEFKNSTVKGEYRGGGAITLPNTFSHYAIVRSGSSCYMFMDGVPLSVATVTSFSTNDVGNITGDIQIGAYNGGDFAEGWIDELRISKGIARWLSDFAVPVAAYSGDTTVTSISNDDGVDVFWKAYKTADAIGAIYECYNGIDKISMSATDAYDDSTVLDNNVCSTDDYGPWPTGIKDVCIHLQRLFGIKDNMLWYSEPYLPFAVDAMNSIAITPEGYNLEAVVEYGGSLYIASASTWHRLVGQTSDTWYVVPTPSEVGTINRHTTKKTLKGILSLYHDGLYLFNGFHSTNVTEEKLGLKFFTDISDKSACFAEFHNNSYYFYYPSTGSTCDKCLRLDMEDMKFYHDNFVPNAFEFHVPTGIEYYGDTDGYQYEAGGSEVISTTLQTGDKAMKNVFRRKQLQYLFYDINTGGKDVTVSIYVDGSSAYSFTLNESSRTRDRQLLPKLEGYRFSVYLTCADSSGLNIYEPWAFGYSFTGE